MSSLSWSRINREKGRTKGLSPYYGEPDSYTNSMPCPECGLKLSVVIDSRPNSDAIRRRRVCPKGHRYTTYEKCRSDAYPGFYEI
jgi:rRNA maturation protein Nop10